MAIAERIWFARSRLSRSDLAIPVPLPYGAWFRAHGDLVGFNIAAYRFARHPYQEGEWKFLKRILQPGDAFIDVGENQGFFTILASRQVGKSGQVVAFEPAPRERTRLLRNLRLNRCTNVSVEPVAVGRESGEAEFHAFSRHQGSLSGLTSGGSDVVAPGTAFRVPVMALDDIYDRLSGSRLRAIKIDAEGAELDVLRGCARLLDLGPAVLCETEEQRTEPWGYKPVEILNLLHQRGYNWYHASADGTLVKAERGVVSAKDMIALPPDWVD